MKIARTKNEEKIAIIDKHAAKEVSKEKKKTSEENKKESEQKKKTSEENKKVNSVKSDSIIKGDANIKTGGIENIRIKLSVLWIFLMFNYLYCDLLGMMDPFLLRQFLNGIVGGINISQGFLLGAAVLMEIPILMVLLSLTLNYKFSRIANIIAPLFMICVQIGSLFLGTGPSMYYLFFSAIEIFANALIVYWAWKWRELEREYDFS